MSWKLFEEQSPDLADFGRKRLHGQIAYLATVTVDGRPRLHPVRPFIGQGFLFLFIDRDSPKGNDLRRSGRYALHCAVPEAREGEFLVTGEATVVTDLAERSLAERLVGYAVPARQVLFQCTVHTVLATTYSETMEPCRQRWEAGSC